MADVYKNTNTLGIGIAWQDADDKEKITYIKLPNPREELTQDAIVEAAKKLFTGDNPILWSTTGATIDSEKAVATAYVEEQEVIDLDLE